MFVVRDPTINAFATPGGFIGVNTGLIMLTNNESELAGVVAHETGHVMQRHIARAVEAQGRNSITSIAGHARRSADRRDNRQPRMRYPGLIAMSQGAAMQQQINFTRMEEQEADRVGIGYLAAAGYDPNGMANFFGVMMHERGAAEDFLPALLLDHPVDSARIAEARARIASLPTYARRPDSPNYQLARERIRVLLSPPDTDLRRYYEKMLANDPGSVSLAYGAAMTEVKAGTPDKAIEILKPLVAAHPELPLLQSELAQAQLAAGKGDDAVSTFERGLQLAPRNVPLTRALCRSAAGPWQAQEGACAAAGPVQHRGAHARADKTHRAGCQRRRGHRRCLLLHVRVPHLQWRPDAGDDAAGPCHCRTRA